MTSVYDVPLGSAAELASRLQRQPPASGSAEADAWDRALLDASNHLRDVVGQPITAADTLLTLTADECAVVRVPFCPVRAVTSVHDGDGYTVTPIDVSDDNRTVTLSPSFAGAKLSVAVSHGFTEVPGELLRWTYMLAAARIADDGGTLGMGGPTSVTVDDARVGYDNAGTSTEIPEAVQERLRATYGGLA